MLVVNLIRRKDDDGVEGPLEPPTPKTKSRVDHIPSATPPAYVIRNIRT